MDITPYVESLRRDLLAAADAAGPEARAATERLAYALDPAVHAPPAAPTAPPPPPAPGADDVEEDGSVARITLRIPESVKAKAEELANRSGHSLNTWLVNLVRGATREGAINVDIDLSSIPFVGGNDPFGGKRGSRRMSGWA